MYRIELNGIWTLFEHQTRLCEGKIPGSVYSFLLQAGKMSDPFYRENELEVLKLIEKDYTFVRNFKLDVLPQPCETVLLRCDGLDTVCTLFLNEKQIGIADNMHRNWEFDVTNALSVGENVLKVAFASPTRTIKQIQANDFIGGTQHAMEGFPHLRKAHCMFGWDWGPRLPDAGIWRDIYLLRVNASRLEDVHVRQFHTMQGEVWLTVDATQTGDAQVNIYLENQEGNCRTLKNGTSLQIEDPQLWWPHGLGNQPLYTVRVELLCEGVVVDSWRKR
ncbi:MAG: glycoside hydrolase family 2 protein, partial [Ruthenibacterium sp.]